MSYPTLPFGTDDPTATTLTLLDRYRVFDQRSGGMGTVFFADDTVFPRRVAIKTIRRERFADPAAFLRATDRFEREKTAAGMVSGQINVVTVHDYLIGPDGTQYLILEYVPGGTLRALPAQGSVRVADASRLVRDAARGLQAAHKVGIVHRDIKPENIFIAADGRAQVGDFGIAQIADLPTRTTDDLRHHPGTPGYMSPEQEHGTNILLPASDQYALGLVLFELLTGTRFAALFPAQRDALLASHPPALAAIVRRMTQEQAEARYPDMAAVIAALEGVIGIPAVTVPTAFVGHSADVQALSCTPDGEMLASGSKDGAICVWRMRDGTLLRTMRPQHFVATVMFAPDGETLASGGVDGLVRIWRVTDGLMLHALPGHGNTVCSVAYTPDGQFLVSGAWDKTVRLWRVADGASLGIFTGHGGVVYSVAVSPDGHLMASGSQDGTVRLWTHGQAHVLRGHRRPVHAIAFSPDGTLLASGGEDGTIRLWNPGDTSARGTVTMRGTVTSLAFTPDGQTLAVGSDHGIVSLWRRNTTLPFGTAATNPQWQQYREFPGRRGWINSLCFAPNQPLLFAAADDALIITHRID